MMEANLVALDVAGKEAEWLWELLFEILILEKLIHGILIHCDNKATIAKIHIKNHNVKSLRHIELNYKILRKLMSIVYNNEIYEVCIQFSQLAYQGIIEGINPSFIEKYEFKAIK